MEAMFRSLWKQIKTHRVMTSIIIIAGSAIFITVAYLLDWEWTGFNLVNSRIWTIRPPMTPSGTAISQIVEQQQAKTLWDWFQLLAVIAIPIVVGFGAAWFTAQQGKVSDRENTDNQREKALQDYIDKMSELMLHEKLRGSAKEDDVRKIARGRTIAILFQLDARRIGFIFEFLQETGLMSSKPNSNIVSLNQANLSKINLSRANLWEANFSGAILVDADLSETNLHGADLSKSNLSKSNLSNANLNAADLDGANLGDANLRKADFFGVTFSKGINLHGADLSGADLSGADLSKINYSVPFLIADEIGKPVKKPIFREANLSRATFNGADLSGIDLSGANLNEAQLLEANLKRANLREAILAGSNLREANLREANLSRATFSGADLSGADLSGADLSGAYLDDAVYGPVNLKGIKGVTVKQLEKQAASLQGATMPDGSTHP
jgi:uncharacterized protein YjbI with pentapeptide repeats